MKTFTLTNLNSLIGNRMKRHDSFNGDTDIITIQEITFSTALEGQTLVFWGMNQWGKIQSIELSFEHLCDIFSSEDFKIKFLDKAISECNCYTEISIF